MKIDARKPQHWLYLLLFLFNVICALLLRPMLHRRRSRRVVLYGHKRSGNLLALHEHALRSPLSDIDFVFLTMDPLYHRQLLRENVASVLATTPAAIRLLSTMDAVISDHGLHSMELMLGRSDAGFFDVWHGIPFKGFDVTDFHVQQRYDEVWVASPLLKSLYVEKFGFRPSQVAVTGYARTDRLVQRSADSRNAAIERLGLPADAGKVVLFAPTWKQDHARRSVFPFSCSADEFCGALSALAERASATIVMRTHLNSGSITCAARRFPRLVLLPFATYPDTEEVLLASDILVCDWSSIAFDFLVLQRPTIFLDVEPPFAKGLSLDGGYRFGAIASGMNELVQMLERYLHEPGRYEEEFGGNARATLEAVYAGFADGQATARCLGRLDAWLAKGEFSR